MCQKEIVNVLAGIACYTIKFHVKVLELGLFNLHLHFEQRVIILLIKTISIKSVLKFCCESPSSLMLSLVGFV